MYIARDAPLFGDTLESAVEAAVEGLTTPGFVNEEVGEGERDSPSNDDASCKDHARLRRFAGGCAKGAWTDGAFVVDAVVPYP